MHVRTLGREGLVVSAVGLGCMGMSAFYGPSSESQALEVLDRALALGVTFWDTAEMYGPFANEELLGRALRGKNRDEVVVATKFAFRFNDKGEPVGLDSSPGHIRQSLEGSLKRLGTDHVDLYYQHRLDPDTPIEDTVGAMADLVREGKVRYIGLSEVGPGIIRRAHAVHPVTAVQSEYSLWERGVEARILPVLRELGIGFVAYSPTGRGFLTGRFKSVDDLDPSDWRRSNPRFQGENFTRNLRLVDMVKAIAADHQATPAQVALAWLLRQGEHVVPIPGTRHVRYLEENARAASLSLPPAAWDALERALAAFVPAGERYSEESMKTIDTTQ